MRTYEVSVHSEQQGTLKQQDASIDLRLLGVALAKSVKHCLAEPVLLGVCLLYTSPSPRDS